MLPPDPSHVYRLLISPNLSHQDMELSINHLKANRIMKELIELNNKEKYGLQASRIIIVNMLILRIVKYIQPSTNRPMSPPTNTYRKISFKSKN